MTAALRSLTLLSAPTFYFIGVTTAQSSIMRIFPQWMDILGLDAQIAGYDAPLHAAPEVYRAIVGHIKSDPLARGGLVTTHKIDLLNAACDLFDELDSYAQLCDEVSAIGKRGAGLFGAAVDVLSSRLTWQTFVPAGHWDKTGGHVLCLGAGGASVAISLCAAAMPDRDRPERFIVVDVNETRLAHIRAIHAKIETAMAFEYVLNSDSAQNDVLMAGLPPGSMVINATGMGKDRPGSPITDAAEFPQNGLVWELNYRGELNFLRQAEHQASSCNLTIEDGWVYFLHGWTQVIAQVFQLNLTPELFAQLDKVASSQR